MTTAENEEGSRPTILRNRSRNKQRGSIVSWAVVSSILCVLISVSEGLSSIKSRAFTRGNFPINDDKPKLIMITGCTGTGKSTFGMSVALDQGILKCISTDTLRSVMRSFVTKDISPALHRSSYEPATEDGSDDPVKSWKQTCAVLQHCVDELVDEMIGRGASIVIEGAQLIPCNDLLQRWEESGGVATGVVLQVPDEEAHKSLLIRRGMTTGKGEERKLEEFKRIRAIHDEMVNLGREVNWCIIEQNLQPDPLEVVASQLWRGPRIESFSTEPMTSRSERRSEQFWKPHQGKVEDTDQQEQSTNSSEPKRGSRVPV